ncbi:hypothetical protein HYU09_03235 [Candidatus Woesearchaeota archaeon]|nr:hypothetical protein [Candidatus Woesearchaeota archaeon]
MKSKKSFALTDTLVWLGVAVLVFLVLVIVVPKLLGKGTAQASDFLSSAKDYDNDGIADYFDKCACVQGSDKYEGCNSDSETKEQAAVERETQCRETIKKAYEKK